MELKVNYIWSFEGYHSAPVTLSENEFDNIGLQSQTPSYWQNILYTRYWLACSLIYFACFWPHRCWAAQPGPGQCLFVSGVSGRPSPCPVPPDCPPCHRRSPDQAEPQVSAGTKIMRTFPITNISAGMEAEPSVHSDFQKFSLPLALFIFVGYCLT